MIGVMLLNGDGVNWLQPSDLPPLNWTVDEGFLTGCFSRYDVEVSVARRNLGDAETERLAGSLIAEIRYC